MRFFCRLPLSGVGPVIITVRQFLIFALFALILGSVASSVSADSAISHVVRPGETLASIAERYYGDPRRESVLVAENSLTSEGGSAIVTGLRLTIPTVSYHKVKEGETWVELAKVFYGDARRAFVLLEANGGMPGDQPDPGAELLIPYPLRHVAGQNENLRHVSKTYYGKKGGAFEGLRRLRRFNRIRRARLQRGQIVLVPLEDLVLSEKGHKLVEERAMRSPVGGNIREKQAQIDSAMPLLREYVRQGRYAESLAMGNHLLGSGDLTGNQIVSIQRELGIAYVALGREDLAILAFKTALEKQPDLELDSARTSPKVLLALKRARQQTQAKQPKKPETKKKNLKKKSKSNKKRKKTRKSKNR
jgi:hypothetical protein